MEIHLRPGKAVLAVIIRAFQRAYLHPVAQQPDEGQEQLPVQSVFVQIFRHAVRGGYHHHPGGKQLFEQPPDDHRIGDVCDLHFVEGQQSQVTDDGIGHRGQCILDTLLAGLVHATVDFLHESVEMHATLGRAVGGGNEQVHHHGFAAPDATPQIQAFRRGWVFAKQAFQQTLFALCHRFGPGAYFLQNRQKGVLRRVDAQRSCRHLRLIDLCQSFPHGGAFSLGFAA